MRNSATAPDTFDEQTIARLDAEDRARVLTTFLGLSGADGEALHYVRRSPDGSAPAWAFDENTGMVYILD